MSWQGGSGIFHPGIEAGEDLSSKQYRFVTQTTANTVIAATAVTDLPLGVLQNAPSSGQAAVVMMVGISKVSADAAIEFGALLGTSADAQAVTKVAGTSANDGEYIVGRALSAVTAANQYVTAAINCLPSFFNSRNVST